MRISVEGTSLSPAANQHFALRRIGVIACGIERDLCDGIVERRRIALLVVPDVILVSEQVKVRSLVVIIPKDHAVGTAARMHTHRRCGG